LALLGGIAAAQDWYISNAAGMALEQVFSRLALRNKYALSVDPQLPEAVPGELAAYYDAAYTVELRTLYEDGEVSKRQWIFRDDARRDRLVAAFGEDGSGFIERYDEQGQLWEEHLIDAGSGDQIVTYSYSHGLLIKSEVRLKSFTPAPEEAVSETPDTDPPQEPDAEPDAPALGETRPAGPDLPAESAPVPEKAGTSGDQGENRETIKELWTDYYRYSRFHSLRAVDRVFHQDIPAEELPPVRLRFPHLILETALAEEDFVSPGAAYGSDFLQDVFVTPLGRILYTVDERGRILRETRYDEDGNVLGELRNTWTEDRVASVSWVSGEDERLTEYEYNDEGDRMVERNYNKGVLERTVRREGEEEVEELYMNGVVILRAVWGKDGRKVSEERVRNAAGTDRSADPGINP
jgi:hypothetical protein